MSTFCDHMNDTPREGSYSVKPFSFKRDEFFIGFSGGDNGIVNIHTNWTFNETVKDFLPENISTKGGELELRYHTNRAVLRDWESTGKLDATEMIANIASLISEQPNGEKGKLCTNGGKWNNTFLCSLNGKRIWIDVVWASYDNSAPLWKWFAGYSAKPDRYSAGFSFMRHTWN